MSRNTNSLHDLIAALAGENSKQKAQEAAFETMRAKGISDDDIRAFSLLHTQVVNLAETLALSVTLNHFTGNLPACRFGLATITFLRGGTQWMYNILDHCKIAPSAFGMQDSPNSFYEFLGKEQDKFNKTLAQHAEDEALINQLFTPDATAKEGPSRAACE